ncbi:MAG: sigma-54-dependent transcriptional regulator [bacterium]
MRGKVLVVDDEPGVCKFLKIFFEKEGFLVETSTDPFEALEVIKSGESFDIVFADIIMPNLNGIEFLTKAKMLNPELKIIMITAYASIETTIQSLRAGAFDYITKPFKPEEIRNTIKRALELSSLRKENIELKELIKAESSSLDRIIGTSKAINEIKNLIRRIAPTDSTVLITGESGTGKELVARAIHELSGRSNGRFVSINCGALPENLLESELFGHVKGAFTGAVRNKEGLFKVADGGTFFLDEIAELQPSLQVKLLRALEEKTIIPIGATEPIEVDVRLIAATNANLEELVKKGVFRADLFYRLNVFSIHIPPIRERTEDILPIANNFIRKECVKLGIPIKHLTKEAAEMLERARWEGNVRELENVLERAILLASGDEIGPELLPKHLTLEGIKEIETHFT